MKATISITLILLSLCFPSHAFVEDVCYYKSPKPKGIDTLYPLAFNCLDFQCDDGVDNGEFTPRCLTTGLATFVRGAVIPGIDLPLIPADSIHVRSVLHFDTTYLLARIAGISDFDAYQIAAYSQAIDISHYQHYRYDGQPLANSDTLDLSGGTRVSQETFGYWMHFLPWRDEFNNRTTVPQLAYQPKSGPKYQSPFEDYEIGINHLRAWAFGKRSSVCQFAMTQDNQKINAPCFNNNQQKTIEAFSPVNVGITNPVSNEGTVTQLQWQPIARKTHCKQTDSEQANANNQCYQKDFASNYKGSPQALGIYLHALTDRISHQRCLQNAAVRNHPDKDSKADYQIVYNSQCGIAMDTQSHNLELGNTLLPERTYLSIETTLKEILAWVKASNYPAEQILRINPHAPKLNQHQQIATMIGNAISQDEGQERVTSLCEIATRYYRLGWHDQSPDCRYDDEQNNFVLSAYYGVDNCIGVADTSLPKGIVDEAKKANCLIVKAKRGETGNTGPLKQFVTGAATPNLIPSVCQASLSAEEAKNLDGLPVTFKYLIDENSLDPQDFTITLANGQQRQPMCATLFPADEKNEARTALLFGHFGTPRNSKNNTFPIKLEITGELQLHTPTGNTVNAKNSFYIGPDLDYHSGPRMLLAELAPFTLKGETLRTGLNGQSLANHCHVNFPDTTHVIRVTFNGGASVDGYYPLKPHQTEFFKLLVEGKQGQLQPNTDSNLNFLGLADLGNSFPPKTQTPYATDGDNIIDLCLQATKASLKPLQAIATSCSAQLNTQLYDPSGDTPCQAQQLWITGNN